MSAGVSLPLHGANRSALLSGSFPSLFSEEEPKVLDALQEAVSVRRISTGARNVQTFAQGAGCRIRKRNL